MGKVFDFKDVSSFIVTQIMLHVACSKKVNCDNVIVFFSGIKS